MVRIISILEHIDPVGIHSDDSNAVLPPFDLSAKLIQQIREHTHKIALDLRMVSTQTSAGSVALAALSRDGDDPATRSRDHHTIFSGSCRASNMSETKTRSSMMR